MFYFKYPTKDALTIFYFSNTSSSTIRGVYSLIFIFYASSLRNKTANGFVISDYWWTVFVYLDHDSNEKNGLSFNVNS